MNLYWYNNQKLERHFWQLHQKLCWRTIMKNSKIYFIEWNFVRLSTVSWREPIWKPIFIMWTDSWVISRATNGLTLGWVNSKFFGVIDSKLSSGLKFTIFFKITEAVSSRFSKNIKVNVKWRFLIFLPFGINRKVVSTASSFVLVLAGINFGRKLNRKWHRAQDR